MGYPFQRRFLERGIKNCGSRLYLLLKIVADWVRCKKNSSKDNGWDVKFLIYKMPGGGGTPIRYLYRYVPPNGVVSLKLLI